MRQFAQYMQQGMAMQLDAGTRDLLRQELRQELRAEMRAELREEIRQEIIEAEVKARVDALVIPHIFDHMDIPRTMSSSRRIPFQITSFPGGLSFFLAR